MGWYLQLAALWWNFLERLAFITTWNIFANLLFVSTCARKFSNVCRNHNFPPGLPSLAFLLLHHISLIILNIVLHQTFDFTINGPSTFLTSLIFIDMASWAGFWGTAFDTWFLMTRKCFLLVHCHVVTSLERACGSAGFIACALVTLHCY